MMQYKTMSLLIRNWKSDRVAQPALEIKRTQQNYRDMFMKLLFKSKLYIELIEMNKETKYIPPGSDVDEISSERNPEQ